MQRKGLKRRPFLCTPSWLETQDLCRTRQGILINEVGPNVSIEAGPNQVVKRMASSYQVITDQRSTVVINQDIAARIRSGEPLRWQEVQLDSVQLRDNLIAKLGLQEILEGIYDWQDRAYDPDLLGYMSQLL